MVEARRAAQWVIGLGVGSAWAGRRLMRTSTFYDEWTIVGQTLRSHPWEAAWTSFNGHLWLFQDAAYRIQLHMGGVDVRWVVVALQLAALAALHAVFARVAMIAGAPLSIALLGGLAVVYMGMAPQNWVFVVQWPAIASLAFALAACGLVVAGPVEPSRSAAVGLLLLAAVVVESGSGTIGVAMAAAVAAVCWGRRAVRSLLPAVAVLGGWYLLADPGPRFPSSLGRQLRFGTALLSRSAGGLLGLGPWLGAVMVLLVAAGSVWVLRSGRVPLASRALVVGGCVGAVVAVAAIARSRAGLPGFSFFDSNRYLFPVAVPFAVAAAPVVVEVVGRIPARIDGVARHRMAWVAVGVLLASGVVIGQRVEANWSPAFLAANEAVRSGVQSTALLLRDGCPGGGPPQPDALPLGSLSPQVSVGLVAELMDEGLLAIDDESTVDAAIAADVCP